MTFFNRILADDSVLMRNAVADLLCAILKENAKNSTDQIDQSEDRMMLLGIINIFCELANAQVSTQALSLYP